MKVAQLAFSLSNRAGGIFEILLGQSHALLKLGVEVVALGLKDDLWAKDRERWGGISAAVFPVQGPRFLSYSAGFARALADLSPDLCHLHSLWMYPGVAMKQWAHKHRKPYMVTPNGMLEPWALRHSGWKKKLSGIFYENAMLHNAACLQANTLKEADDFRAYGLRNRVEIIPNGVDLPDIGKTESGNAEKLKEGRKRLLFLGRIHPKKGLVGLLRAWADIQNPKSGIKNSKDWELVLAGWDQLGHEAELRALCAELGLRVDERMGFHGGTADTAEEAADVVFHGPAFGEEKESLFRSADAFVLPSFSEGLPMSVLEAWSYGLPTVMTPECNLPEGFTCQAAVEIRNGEMSFQFSDFSFQHGLRTLLEMSDWERAAMGMRGRRLVEEKFTWPKVAASLKEVYASLN